jgi:hypothetical protein
MLPAAVLLVLFSAAASTDSLYFHTYKYRLHARAASRFEHWLHTANICLFVPQTYLLFCAQARGAWLVLAAALTLATFVVEMVDVLCERSSRADLGGLIPTEYAMHFLMGTLRAGYVGLLFAGVRAADFVAPASLGPSPVAGVGWMMVVPGAIVALFHLWLCRTPLDAPSGRAAPLEMRPTRPAAPSV